MAIFRVSSNSALVDEVIRIVVTGLHSGQKITTVAYAEEDKKGWVSHAHFQATNEGIVNLAEHHPLGGSYKGIIPMGLFCSSKVLPGEREGLRLRKTDTSEPLQYKLLAYNGFVEPAEVLQAGILPLAVKSLDRWYRREGVTVETISSGAVRGKLYLPSDSGPFPGVIDMYGSTGGIYECRSALLASHGFATLCLPFFKYEDLPTELQVNLEYFEEAVEVLRSHPKVFSHGIGVIGTSFGGEIGLSIASYLPNKDKVKAVVAVSSPVAHGPYLLYKGKHFPFCDFDFVEYDEGVSFEDPNTIIRPETVIQLEKTTAKLLFVWGEDDKCYAAVKHRAALKEYMKKHNKTNYDVLFYPRAGHLIDPPYTPLVKSSWHRLLGGLAAFGGKVEEHSFAQEDSWKKVLSFLHEHVSDNSATSTPTKT